MRSARRIQRVNTARAAIPWLVFALWFSYSDRVRAADPPRRPGAAKQSDAAAKLARDCAAVAKRLDDRLGDDCHVISRPPFVIGGDMSERRLREWHTDTIGPAARAMAHCYFETAPDRPITVLLFTGEQSYNHYAKELFGDDDVSIYGYYKPGVRTLVMNIGTGGGTLVHELTHALIDFDYSRVPDWFNEGLASLHEQCGFREGPEGPWVEGFENWRLPGLKEAIRRGRLRPLASLIRDDDFRGRQEGTNYAQARYFCLYMQRKGMLKDCYRALRRHQKDDPLGYQTISDLFADVSWARLDHDFQAWVLTLKRDGDEEEEEGNE